ncbi:conserved hypothetical protein [Gammaproteobacteria bacterium]
MPLQATSGAASYDAFGGGVAAVPNYIEDVFSTWLYQGTGSAQTITNGIDLSTKGGMVWEKTRTTPGFSPDNMLFDTLRGPLYPLYSNTNTAPGQYGSTLTAFNTNGFTVGGNLSQSGVSHASWTFRKQPKFFDIQTWTGTGANRTISHSLGSVPACIIVKRTDAVANWPVYHRGLSNVEYVLLNDTSIAGNNASLWNSTTPTSTVFSLGTDTTVNASGGTYVAYIFAHDAGGFGLLGTDNVISCGSYTGNGSATGPTISLGYEPQLVFIKKATGSGGGGWHIFDVMRGWSIASNTADLNPNTSSAESSTFVYAAPNATGFQILNTWTDLNQSGSSYVYIAIRRGPMKVPTSGTSVFGLNARSGTGADATVTGGQTDDAVLVKNRGSAVGSLFASRLTSTGYLVTSTTAAEVAAGTTILQANPWDVMDGVKVGTTDTITNATSNTYINYLFKRAPSFMDVVCYTGTAAARTINHNLGVVPELMILKSRSNSGTNYRWPVYASPRGSSEATYLDSTDEFNSAFGGPFWNSTSPTASVFSLGTNQQVNGSGVTYVAYLFATCAGVSKVGSYTGNGTTQTIDCGLTAGARFVLLKRTDAAGAWYVYDTARGMTTLTDPYWLTNSSAAEAATLGSVTTVATGFAVNSAILSAINTNAATYIFLAVA